MAVADEDRQAKAYGAIGTGPRKGAEKTGYPGSDPVRADGVRPWVACLLGALPRAGSDGAVRLCLPVLVSDGHERETLAEPQPMLHPRSAPRHDRAGTRAMDGFEDPARPNSGPGTRPASRPLGVPGRQL